MYINKEILTDYIIPFPLEQYAPLSKILFLDIETTGLSPTSSQLYMIGLAYYKENNWCIEQWMAQKEHEERELLLKLVDFLPEYSLILHFNGNRFDIPYLTEKAKANYVDLAFDNYQGIDIYKRLSPLKNLLALPDCRQKTIEQYLGIDRLDKFTGGELIHIYKSYLSAPSDSALQLLIQHNRDDMKGMLDIIPALAYSEMGTCEPTVTRVEMLKSTTVDQQEIYQLLMTLKFPFSLPKKFFTHADGCFFTAENNRATLKVPVYEDELKLFYANYSDYYYIPCMDAAYHKSVASHADPSIRKQATAETCYTRKESLFLKQYDILVEPFFKKNYKDKESYFEITDELKTNRKLFSLYCSQILSMLLS
jgi:uncharacterized protein YprB with RNaseH-like and TPR domain